MLLRGAVEQRLSKCLLVKLGIAHLHCAERTICPFGTNQVQVSGYRPRNDG